ncbi:MAG TPA: hypothetical protein VIJ93_06915, partial [bacterium]
MNSLTALLDLKSVSIVIRLGRITNIVKNRFPSLLILLAFVLVANSLQATTYSYTSYVPIPTLMATPQWCPSDAAITYQTNQPTNFALPTGPTACGYP